MYHYFIIFHCVESLMSYIKESKKLLIMHLSEAKVDSAARDLCDSSFLECHRTALLGSLTLSGDRNAQCPEAINLATGCLLHRQAPMSASTPCSRHPLYNTERREKLARNIHRAEWCIVVVNALSSQKCGGTAAEAEIMGRKQEGKIKKQEAFLHGWIRTVFGSRFTFCQIHGSNVTRKKNYHQNPQC